MSNLTHNNDGAAQPIRCAIYARYSSDVQKQTSIEDQLRNCREFAQRMGWVVLPEYIRFDEGISGAELGTRTAILTHLQDAKKNPRPFDCILIDSTSRFGRDLSDTLKLSKIFKFNGVFLYFVTQRLDTRERYAGKLQTVYGMQDEDFLETHRENVHRGLKGIALKGYHTGGTHYGYKRTLVYHPTDKDEHGRPAVDHVELEVQPEQAAIVFEIFNLRAEGKSFRDITKHLNKKSLPGPRGKAWSYSTVKNVINDELYIGKKKWNVKKNEMDPETYATKRKLNPENDWVVEERAVWRIVPQELWERVLEANRTAKRFRQRLGGENRTANSRTYLFSGSLRCGICSRSMCIIGGGGADNRRRSYGCPAHRFEGKCPNNVTIRLDRLEDQLINAMIEKLQPPVLEKYLRVCQSQIEEYLAKEANAEKPNEPALRKRLEQLEKEQSNIATAIASVGPSDALLNELTRIEKEKKDVKRELARISSPSPVGISFEEFKAFVRQKAGDLRSVLRGDPAAAKATIKRAVRQLVLTPIENPNGTFFSVSGDVDLFAGESCVVLGEAIEHSAKHYTPLLSLTGLQLDPRRAVISSIPSGLDDVPPASFGSIALPIHDMARV